MPNGRVFRSIGERRMEEEEEQRRAARELECPRMNNPFYAASVPPGLYSPLQPPIPSPFLDEIPIPPQNETDLEKGNKALRALVDDLQKRIHRNNVNEAKHLQEIRRLEDQLKHTGGHSFQAEIRPDNGYEQLHCVMTLDPVDMAHFLGNSDISQEYAKQIWLAFKKAIDERIKKVPVGSRVPRQEGEPPF